MQLIKKIKKLVFYILPSKVIFFRIYWLNVWGDKESKSGPGSNIKSTSNLIQEMQKVITEFKIKKILDIPCGDFNWFNKLDLTNIEYKGADIVNSLIKHNQNKYSCKNINFETLDIRYDKLPDADLLVCRDLFIHLSNKDILKVIENIKKCNIKYILLSSYNNVSQNEDIPTGKFRPVNLFLVPFNFPIPIIEISDSSENSVEEQMRKSLGLWTKENLYKIEF